MNKIKVSILILLIVIVYYLSISFTAWELNPYYWNTDARLCGSLLACPTIIIGLLVLFDVFTNNNKK